MGYELGSSWVDRWGARLDRLFERPRQARSVIVVVECQPPTIRHPAPTDGMTIEEQLRWIRR